VNRGFEKAAGNVPMSIRERGGKDMKEVDEQGVSLEKVSLGAEFAIHTYTAFLLAGENPIRGRYQRDRHPAGASRIEPERTLTTGVT